MTRTRQENAAGMAREADSFFPERRLVILHRCIHHLQLAAAEMAELLGADDGVTLSVRATEALLFELYENNSTVEQRSRIESTPDTGDGL